MRSSQNQFYFFILFLPDEQKISSLNLIKKNDCIFIYNFYLFNNKVTSYSLNSFFTNLAKVKLSHAAVKLNKNCFF